MLGVVTAVVLGVVEWVWSCSVGASVSGSSRRSPSVLPCRVLEITGLNVCVWNV